MNKLSVIIINYNTPEMTERVIRRFYQCEPALAAELILIDNNSAARLSPEIIAALGAKYIENTENLGFAKAVNLGLKIATGEFILLLNSDVLLEPESISKMIDALASDTQIGVIGPKMIYHDGRAQVSCGYFPNLLREFIRLSTLYKIIPFGTLAKANYFNKELFEQGGEVDWLSGGCFLIRRPVIEKIGLFDEHFFFGVEDIDFCFRAKQAGFKVIYLPQSQVVHHHGLSSGGPRTIKKMEMERDNLDYFFKKHYPDKAISRWLIWLAHSIKIFLIKLFESYSVIPGLTRDPEFKGGKVDNIKTNNL